MQAVGTSVSRTFLARPACETASPCLSLSPSSSPCVSGWLPLPPFFLAVLLLVSLSLYFLVCLHVFSCYSVPVPVSVSLHCLSLSLSSSLSLRFTVSLSASVCLSVCLPFLLFSPFSLCSSLSFHQALFLSPSPICLWPLFPCLSLSAHRGLSWVAVAVLTPGPPSAGASGADWKFLRAFSPALEMF